MRVNNYFMNVILVLFWLGLAVGKVFPGSPVWTFEPLTPTTIAIPINSTSLVQYRVTNQSTKPHTLSMRPISGVTQILTGLNVCKNPFTLLSKASCILELQIDGSQLSSPIMGGPIICQQGNINQCYRPNDANILHITQASSLTAINPTSGVASGGTSFTLTGTSLLGASNISFGGVAVTSFNVINSTTVTGVTPAHAPGTVDVFIDTPAGGASLTNGYTYMPTAVGQPAFGGIIACLDGGLNNLIAAIADNSSGIQWGGYETAIGTGAQSVTDGASNTIAIVNTLTVNQGIPINSYAAGICSTYEIDSQGNTPCQRGNTCYDDWFLPSGDNITLSGQLNCLYTNNALIGDLTNQPYWSSTESSTLPNLYAWSQELISGIMSGGLKWGDCRVRCVRAFTP